MGTTAQKLQNIIDSKAAISAAIEAKGGTVPTELTGYGAAIEALPSGGGSSDLAAKIIDGSVTEVTAADLSGATSIRNYGFHQCYDLSSITLPSSLTIIGSYAFQNCSSLKSIDIPNPVTKIGASAFNGCSSLSSVTITNSTNFDGTQIFSNCNELKSIVIPNLVTKLGQGIFSNCRSLSSVTVPSSVTSIDASVFSGCSSLTSIIFQGTLTSINGYNNFQGCSSCLIFDFSSATAVPTLANTNAFQNTNPSKKIIVPDELYDSWKAANNWN